ncbi:MAG TPA: TIGR01777 family oxidoreductase, partial [Parachlamydiaceae bacterium]|nr:TIGR01777 family oxidoreductase [Parachlamydiaceae bacterium]
MKVLISGASGLVGKALQTSLQDSGNEVFVLVRDRKEVSPNAIFWNPKDGLIDIASLEDFDAVVNLSGENIAGGRWTEALKKQLLDSRVESTTTLVNALTRLNHPPKVLINASAVGYYGNRGDEICTEETHHGTGFLADVCRQWEEAAIPAEQKGIRTVILRTGVVLSANGGAFTKMLLPFKLGGGGKLGSGEQYMS